MLTTLRCAGGWLLAAWLGAALCRAEDQPAFQKVSKAQQQNQAAAAPTGNLQLIGNTSYTEAQLRVPLAESLREIHEQGLTRPRADDAAYFVAIYYRKQGFPDAEVNWAIQGSVLVLTIKEGPRAYLGKITYAGNKSQPTNELDQYMIGETAETRTKDSKGFPFVEADIQTGVARVRGVYENEGHLDAKIDDAVITWSADRTRADVLVKIVEGPRYTFGDIVFSGESPFPRETLIEALGEVLANPYNTQRLNTMQHNLEHFFKTKGYYTAEVSAQGDPKKAVPGKLTNRKVPVTFTIKVGAFYRFDHVTIAGLDRLHPAFVENRFRGLVGKPYSPELLESTYLQVLQTGLFHNLRINTVPLEETGEVRIDLTAEEAKAKEIGFSLGFSSYEGALLGVRLSDRDFMGRGRPLSLDIDYTSRAIRAEILYVDKWLFESPYELRSRLFLQSRTEIGYTKHEEGIRADLTKDFGSHYEAGTFLSARNVTITDANIQPQFLGPISYQIATLGITQSLYYLAKSDKKDRVNPSKGLIVTTAFDVDTIASNVAFGRGTGRITYYLPIKSYLLAVGARAGAIYPVSNIPIDERYFNGGATTVRSFAERELGPKDPKSANPIGGEFFTVFNAELEIPIKGDLSGAVFFDAGNIVSEFKEASLDDMRFGIGVGVRYKLPIGPIRLDIGLNPNPKQYEKWGAVQFSVGFAF